MKHLRSLTTPALLAVLTALAPLAAHAGPTGKDRAEAVQLRNDARKATKENRHADAVKALTKANELDPNPQIEMDLAKALIADHKLVEATKVLRRLSDPDSKTTPRPMKAEAKKMLGEVEAKVPWVQVTVEGPPSGKALTRIDDVETDASVEAAVDPGEHKIEATAEGYEPGSATVKVAEGAHEKVTIKLKAKPAAVKVEETKGSLIPGIVTVSIGGAGLAVGGIFGALAFSATAAAKSNCNANNQCTSAASGDISRSKTFGTVSTIGFIAGGAIAAAGVVLLIVRPGGGKKETPATGLRVTPWIGAGEGGVAGTF